MEKAKENGTRLNKYLVGFPRFGGRLYLNFQYNNWQQENAYNFCSFLNHFLTVFSLRIPGFAPCVTPAAWSGKPLTRLASTRMERTLGLVWELEQASRWGQATGVMLFTIPQSFSTKSETLILFLSFNHDIFTLPFTSYLLSYLSSPCDDKKNNDPKILLFGQST